MDRSFRQLQLLEAWRRITVGACHPCDHAPRRPPPATRPAPAIRCAIRGGLDRGRLLVAVTHGFPVFGHSRRLPAWGPNRHRFSRCTTPPLGLFFLVAVEQYLALSIPTPPYQWVPENSRLPDSSTANSQPKRPGQPLIAHHGIRPLSIKSRPMIRDQHGRHATSGEANSNTHHTHQPYRILTDPAA